MKRTFHLLGQAVPLVLSWAAIVEIGFRMQQYFGPPYGVEAISSTLSTLPILAPDSFGEFAGRKNRIKNYCEQDDPTSCRHDREDQAASPRHWAFPSKYDLSGAAVPSRSGDP